MYLERYAHNILRRNSEELRPARRKHYLPNAEAQGIRIQQYNEISWFSNDDGLPSE